MFNLFLGGIGATEVLFIAFFILIFFGGKKIPELMRGLGQGIKEFNNAKSNIEQEVRENMKDVDTQKK